jgi:hypothetical protein
VLWRIVAGNRFAYSDPKLQDLMKNVGTLTGPARNFSFISLIFMLPFLKTLFPSLDNVKRMASRYATIISFLQATIDQHKKNFDPDNIEDFIDAFLAKTKVSFDLNSRPVYHGIKLDFLV